MMLSAVVPAPKTAASSKSPKLRRPEFGASPTEGPCVLTYAIVATIPPAKIA
jgi:hypothetical protein